ncbi:response regulator transcription factor [uncultured Paracoccus sp.]|uniref:response regulator transcription factor n=1 Tax=uncultured Paracoccus sp. TaxID=189685 RepID=UPI00262DCCAA|nr:response regulator transcription factor [uncultured Paracoccus sp.]
MRVLLVEDEADIADALARFLRAQGHAVDHAPDLGTAQAALDVAKFDAILLDIALPDGSGLTLLRDQRRGKNRVPVIIATARDQISERIAGLDAGADDYVVKPYDLAEIAARLRAHGRRASGDPAAESYVGTLKVDRAGARLFRGADEIRLTSREWALFDALLSARGRVLSKQVLEDRLYAYGDAVEGNAVEVYVSRLRSKIGADAIQTRRGLGYLIP